MSRWGRRNRRIPDGFEYVSGVLDALESELREKMNEPHEGKRKCEALWPIHQINWQRSRYIYDLYYKYKKISKEIYDYCINQKLVDANLIAKWKKKGYERLCSTYAINPKNYNYGTVSICRVPKSQLSEGQVVQDQHSGCRGCCSGPGGYHNIFGNKYGQYLAQIQVEREDKLKKRRLEDAEARDQDEGHSDASNDGKNGKDEKEIWVEDIEDEEEKENTPSKNKKQRTER